MHSNLANSPFLCIAFHSVFKYISSLIKSSHWLGATSFHWWGWGSVGGINWVTQRDVHHRTGHTWARGVWLGHPWATSGPWTSHTTLLGCTCLHLFLSHTLSNSYLDSCLRLIFLSLPPTPVLGVHLFLLIQTILSSEPEVYSAYAHKAKGSFCHISEWENQFNKYLLSTYSVQGMICILKRKMVWPWGSGKNKNMVQPTCKCLGQYREQGRLHKVLFQSD